MRSRNAWFVVSLIATASGCASNPAPRAMLRSPEQMQRTAFGSYVAIASRDGGQIGGELIAVDHERLYVLSGQTLHNMPVANVEKATLAAYSTGESEIAGWGALGIISTLSHGYLLIFSAPVWLLSTSVAAGVESRAALFHYPERPLESFRPYARFPQGIPPGVDANGLLHGRRQPPSLTPAPLPETPTIQPGASAPGSTEPRE